MIALIPLFKILQHHVLHYYTSFSKSSSATEFDQISITVPRSLPYPVPYHEHEQMEDDEVAEEGEAGGRVREDGSSLERKSRIRDQRSRSNINKN